MGRPLRTTAGGLVYHVLNRAHRRATLFAHPADYAAFVRTIAEAQEGKGGKRGHCAPCQGADLP